MFLTRSLQGEKEIVSGSKYILKEIFDSKVLDPPARYHCKIQAETAITTARFYNFEFKISSKTDSKPLIDTFYPINVFLISFITL